MVVARSGERSKPGIAYSRRRTSARERTVIRPTAFEAPKPKYNRQKARRLRKRGDAGTRRHGDAGNSYALAGNAGSLAGNAGALACNAGSSGVRNESSIVAGGNLTASGRRGGDRAGEGACVPGKHSTDSIDSANSTDSPDFHTWLKTLPSIWDWDARHQLYLYEHLQRVTDGTCKRLMIFMPPRHGKSELVTVRYTAWRLRQDPSLNVILASYGQDLANRFSRKIKRVLIDDFALAGTSCGSGWFKFGPREHRCDSSGYCRGTTDEKAAKTRVQSTRYRRWF